MFSEMLICFGGLVLLCFGLYLLKEVYIEWTWFQEVDRGYTTIGASCFLVGAILVFLC